MKGQPLMNSQALERAFLLARQRPALAGGEPPTTIGAEELNYRVRDGNGCGLFAIAARHFKEVHSLKTRYMRSKQRECGFRNPSSSAQTLRVTSDLASCAQRPPL